VKKLKFTSKKLTLISLAISAAVISLTVLITVNRHPVDSRPAAGDANAPAGSEEKFNYLASRTGSNTCGLQGTAIEGMAEDGRIQGSCCSKMDPTAYQRQVEGLRKYAGISEIPPDPYDISVKQAKVLLSFKDGITLTSEQQEIYSRAAELSEEGGPCCCKCWHWDAYEGLAKKMIADYGWDAEQVAELWDLSSACGGPVEEHG